MAHKTPRNERDANLGLAREIPVMTFYPDFLRPAPKRAPRVQPKQGLIKTLRNFFKG